ncbi:membrane protein [Bacterioplanes sanyensis]|uniref:YjgN family protein n=1 Tax=Bacterioplanes sanyensis TaxID=1249553 RepID=UPI00167763F9|nr:YjgN family protein [Bacterioplanes sanyensis]GGY52258.1 membrane protein [Bacterioplanes sanyensis]
MTPTDTAALPSKTFPVEFSGTKAGYFKLWFVNLLLSILTLGIYSAWAKVRNNQYLYGHTQIDGHRLNYLATPWQILRGRILAILVFGGAYLLATLVPPIMVLFVIGYIFVLPWAIGQGLRFTMRMTSYRNVRFSFEASYGDLFVHFILLPMVAAFTLYLTAPWIHKQISEFLHRSVTYGGKPLKIKLSTGHFYFAVLCTLFVGLIVGLLVLALILLGTGLVEMSPGYGAAYTGAGFILGYLGATFCSGIYMAMIRNHVMNNLEAEGLASFRSNVEPLTYATIAASNVLLLMLTLGLAFPITRIRMLRYTCAHTRVTLTPAIATMQNTVDEKYSAFGEEAAGLFDSDLSLA